MLDNVVILMLYMNLHNKGTAGIRRMPDGTSETAAV